MPRKIPKTQKRFTYNPSTGEYESEIVGCGVPSVPHVAVVGSVSNSNWTASWTIPHGCRAFELKLREDDVDLKVATESTGDPYFTIKAAAEYTQSLIVPELYGNENGSTLYFQTATGAGNVEILYWLDGAECHTPS